MLPDALNRIRKVIGDETKAAQVEAIILEEERKEKTARSQKQISGIEAAKERGVQFGRPPMEFPRNFSKIYRKQQEGSLTVTEASRALNISRQQFYRLRKRYEEEHLGRAHSETEQSTEPKPGSSKETASGDAYNEFTHLNGHGKDHFQLNNLQRSS